MTSVISGDTQLTNSLLWTLELMMIIELRGNHFVIQ